MSDLKVSLYPIVGQYNVLLACPDCGEDMIHDPEKFTNYYPCGTNEVVPRVTYNYVCPKCGKKVTSDCVYPCQRISFDKSKKEVLSELEFRKADVF